MSHTKEIRDLLKQVQQSAEKIKSNIQGLDDQIKTLNVKRRQLANMPLAKDDYLSVLRLDIQNKATFFKNTMARHLKATNLKFLSIETARVNGLNVSYTDAGMFNGQLSAHAFYFYFEDEVIKGMERVLEGTEWPTDTLPLSDIQAQISSIDEQIAALTEQRDAIAADLISTGLTE